MQKKQDLVGRKSWVWGGLIALGAFVYYNSWIGGFPITEREFYYLFTKFNVQTTVFICIFICMISKCNFCSCIQIQLWRMLFLNINREPVCKQLLNPHEKSFILHWKWVKKKLSWEELWVWRLLGLDVTWRCCFQGSVSQSRISVLPKLS